MHSFWHLDVDGLSYNLLGLGESYRTQHNAASIYTVSCTVRACPKDLKAQD